MKAKITAFLESLITYDYILFGGVFIAFILFIILGIVLRKKTAIASMFIILAFGSLFFGPTIGYVKMHQYLFKNSVEVTSFKQLTFTNAVVVKGKITNDSKQDFKSCSITARIIKQGKNKYKNYINSFKPLKKMTLPLYDITIGDTREFKMIVEPFTYAKDFNITLGAKCR